MSPLPPKSRLDEGTTFRGFIIGIIAGALYTLFHIRQNGHQLRQSLLNGTFDGTSSVESSLEAGKAKARERKESSTNRD
jgi:hypothetical protein